MRIHVRIWGNYWVLRIPKTFAPQVGLEPDLLVDVSLVEGILIAANLYPQTAIGGGEQAKLAP